MPDHIGDIAPAVLGTLDPVKVGADLGCQNGLGVVLLDDVTIQIGDQIFRLEIEIDLLFLFPGSRLFEGKLLGQDNGACDLDRLPELLGQKLADFLFQLLGIGYFFESFFHNRDHNHLVKKSKPLPGAKRIPALKWKSRAGLFFVARIPGMSYEACSPTYRMPEDL